MLYSTKFPIPLGHMFQLEGFLKPCCSFCRRSVEQPHEIYPFSVDSFLPCLCSPCSRQSMLNCFVSRNRENLLLQSTIWCFLKFVCILFKDFWKSTLQFAEEVLNPPHHIEDLQFCFFLSWLRGRCSHQLMLKPFVLRTREKPFVPEYDLVFPQNTYIPSCPFSKIRISVHGSCVRSIVYVHASQTWCFSPMTAWWLFPSMNAEAHSSGETGIWCPSKPHVSSQEMIRNPTTFKIDLSLW